VVIDTDTLVAKAKLLKSLIDDALILVLPNVWDVGSAKIVERAEFPIVATSSGGVAWSLGYSDGECISRDEMLGVVARISANVGVPVTADLESGYGSGAESLAETVLAALEAGAVGANFEDSTNGPNGRALIEFDHSVERIKAAREAALSVGVPFVINARTDTFAGGGNDSSFSEAVRRGNAYLQVGADCIFVPFINDINMIKDLVKEIQGPINILLGPASPAVQELQDAGVARVSIGGLFSLVSYSNVQTACEELHQNGTYDWARNALAHPEMNALMAMKDGET